MALKYSATRYKQKTEIFSLPDHQLAENQILVFWFLRNENKQDKSKFVTEYVGIMVTIIFM